LAQLLALGRHPKP